MALRSGTMSASLLGIALVFAVAQGAAAQAAAFPLSYAVNSSYNFGGAITRPVLILTINVGVNGGAAQPYAFDTGSARLPDPKRCVHWGDAFGVKRQHRDLRDHKRKCIQRRCVSDIGFVAQILRCAGSIIRRNFAKYIGQLQRRLVPNTQRRHPAFAAIRNRGGWCVRCRPSSLWHYRCRGGASRYGQHFRSDDLAQHHSRLCSLGEWSKSGRAEFATGYERPAGQ